MTSRSYGQYCPITRALDILGERWTLLIVRDLLVGTTRFNELARGLPGLSRSLLAARLRGLQRDGIVAKDGQDYVLTAAGRALEPVVFGIGAWGAAHAFGEPIPEELDPELLVWWAHDRIDAACFDAERTVLAFELREPVFRAWLVIERGGTSVCTHDPGFEVGATLRARVADLLEVWLGRRPLVDSLRDGTVEAVGLRPVVDALPEALRLSPAAGLVQQAQASTVS